ncbi:MAG: L,D-transpeptidase [Verrucomicrobiaceae bacterium]|nr:L,D-transpeptidase [Verrucomicrobiaceae bacterium]
MIHRLLSPSSLALVAAGAVLVLSGCSTPEEDMAAQGWWSGDRMTGAPKITIDLTRQVVRYYKGGKLAGAAPISSGREGHGTVRGNYRIIEKDADHRSSLYGSFVSSDGTIVEGDVDVRRDSPPPGTRFLGASMRSFMRITGGIGMHEGYLPGFAASHGCIRLPSRMAAIFFRSTPLGTPVEIIGETPAGHLTTWLPVPHKLRREDIVIAPKDEGDTRPKARVAIADPPAPPNPKPVEKPVEKPAVVAAAEPPAVPGATKFLDAKPAPAAKPESKVEVASANPKKSFWGGMFGGADESPAAKPQPAAAKPPVRGETQFVDSSAPVPAPKPEKKVEVAAVEPKKSFWGGLFGGDSGETKPKPAPKPAAATKPVPQPAPVVVAAKPEPAPQPKPAKVITAAPPVDDSPQTIAYRPLSSLDQKSSGWGWSKKNAAPQPKTPPKGKVRGQTYFLPGY